MATRRNIDSPGAGRRDRLLRELVHDPYKPKRKLPEPTVCPDCKAVFHRGRWTWEKAAAGAHEEPCPACRRVQERVPAGFLTLGGEFLAAHVEEIMSLARNVEQRENAAHPLKRIMDMDAEGDGIVISFTDPHLARGIGEAIHDAYEGELEYEYSEGEYLLRVSWRRDQLPAV